jgi:hypothetical protein
MKIELTSEAIAYLRYVHGGFNFLVALLIMNQFRLGRKIKKARELNIKNRSWINLHRRMGPFLVALGIGGFLAGSTLILIDEGRILFYPLHFIFGALISASLVTMYILSRNKKSRSLHGKMGGILVLLYIVQILLGIGVLL